LTAIGGVEYLTELLDSVPTAANAGYYAKIVQERAVLRRLITASNEISTGAYEPDKNVGEFLQWAESTVFKIADKQSHENIVHVRDPIKSVFEEMERRFDQGSTVFGTPTGFLEFDQLTAGLHPGQLLIIAARPGMGKTSLVLNLLRNAAYESHKPVVIFSLEMSREELSMRLLQSEARIDASRLKVGKLQESDWPKLTRAAGLLSDLKIYIDDTPGINIAAVRSKCRRIKSENGDLGLVIVDYLQLMKGVDKVESREREISDISRSLKALAKELGVPVMACSQLNRGVESRPNKRPMLSDLRESGAIEQDADMVAFIYRDEHYNKESEWAGTAELIIAKHRSGPTAMIRLAFQGQYTRFDNLAREVSIPGDMQHPPPG
jgi:replicative DNA helicase